MGDALFYIHFCTQNPFAAYAGVDRKCNNQRKDGWIMACCKSRLSQMMPGQRAVIRRIDAPAALADRLTALGILEGTNVKCLGAGPLGDPVAYEVRRTIIALRRADCAGIEVY